MLDVWRRADRGGVFESGWTFDHLYPLFGDSSGDCMEGWTTLTALLAVTERLRGGVLVTGMVYRHPGVLANMASTLDIVSGGRLELGVGAGWNQEECDAFGIELGTLTERFDRFEEGLQVLEGLLTNDRTTFHGRYYRLTGLGARRLAEETERQQRHAAVAGERLRRRGLALGGGPA